MAAQSNNTRSIASKMADGILEKLESGATQSVGDYCSVKRFADEFNTFAVLALREAGVKTKLRAIFKESGNECEIRAGNFFTDRWVATVRAYDVNGGMGSKAKDILDNLPIKDREKVQHNMPRVLGPK